jgi:hypothetical protein
MIATAITTEPEATLSICLGVIILLFPRALSIIMGVILILGGLIYFYPNMLSH